MNLNTAMFVGRLAGDPILKSYKKADGTEGARCFFRVAVTRLSDRGAKQEERRVNFIPVVTWGDAAKRHAHYLAKGTEVAVSGELIATSEKQQDGSFREYFAVQASDIQYGRRSMKNQSRETIEAEIVRLQKSLSTLGTPAPAAEVPAPVAPLAAPAQAQNPFEV